MSNTGTQQVKAAVGQGGITITENGFESMYHGNPWHNSIGRMVPLTEQAPTVEDCLKLGYLNWDVEKVQDVDPRNPNRKINNWKIFKVVPEDKQSEKDFFCNVSDRYTPVQNREMLELGNELMSEYMEDKVARLSSVGSLHGGAMCFASFYMPKHEINIKGDITKQYLNLVWGHSGLVGINLGVMSFRPECENMVMHAFHEAARLEESGGLGLKLKHSGTIHARIETMKKHVSASLNVMDGLKAKFGFLAERKVKDEKQLAEVITNVFELKSKSKSEELTEQAKTLIGEITNNYARNVNNVNANLRGTLFDAYQSVTFYLNHQSVSRETEKAKAHGYDDAARRQAAMVTPNGKGYNIANRAMLALLKIAKAN